MTSPSRGRSRSSNANILELIDFPGDSAHRTRMKKASEYRQHAVECRQLASRMDLGEHRDQLLEMAATWDALARDRAALIRRYPELALEGEGAEDGVPDRPVQA